MDFVHMMSSIIVSICFFIFYCFSFSLQSTDYMLKSNETDQLALLQFKAKVTHDPLEVLSSWNYSRHFCQWKGVTCSPRHQRVTALRLPSLLLQGSLSPHIGNLSFLRVLDLSNNSFRNEIPQEIGYLFRLRILWLDNNTYGGQIPDNISHCVNLESLFLGFNELVGKVPGKLGFLPKLRILVIHSNNLSGEIPSSFGNLSSLEVLSATVNQFVGQIPETLSELKMMRYISFGGNKLSGEIPFSIYNLSSLNCFSFLYNQLQGSLPSDLGFTLPNLEVLNVADNQFVGPIPASISNTSNLMKLAIGGNGFSGKVPSLENLHKLQRVRLSLNHLGNGEKDDLEFVNSLVNASGLELLEISSNNFGGMLPEAVGNLSTQLKILEVDNNQLFGNIPSGLRNLVNLELLYLEDNQFTGRIPGSIGDLQKLQTFRLEGNKFWGEIPSSIGNLTLLITLNFAENMLEGSIPSSLGKCQNLILLDLSNNNLTGTIPTEVIGLSSLSIYLDLSQNQLTGPLPSNFGILKNLGAIDISENKLSGQIPSSIGSCIRLEQLVMKGNFLQENIPSSLSSLRGIENLDLSRNNLSGRIPKYLENFPFLQNLNLSFNHFEGEVPIKGVFSNSSAISLDGNDNLCGGISELHLSTCSIKESKQSRSRSLKLIIPIVTGILLVTGMSCLIITSWGSKSKRELATPPSASLASVLRVSYENLFKATDGFSLENLIAAGSFGSVYKGVLNHDDHETLVAVKVLNLQHRGASKSFMAECQALRSIRHRNLVKIITSCASVDFQGNDFEALVYEFMVNGSLEEWLHPNREAPRNLNLLQRLNIAVDVASALDYLHHYCETPIVHCDLKPSNVLLDSELIAHVGDFGLAKFLPEATNNLSSNQSSSVGVKGTVGYAAPEYGMGSEVSTSGDVYSFGILLLETFTGKRPTNEMFTGNLTLHNFVKGALPERLAEIVDPALLVEREEGETSEANAHKQFTRSFSVKECLVSVLEIGVTCSSELPRERMSMEEVAAQLLSFRNKLVKNVRGQPATYVTA
ncbi:putative LRR receptor-like serine/threonine-protein kinase [Citrus sinensis]|uniref:LRR receptor-like serine/threonine-protein kinase n=1 Tax=Citrus sinensis TaxID=2711 RepID=A0ACB8LEC5_CITSI|nr:putative LRR receptor-like serine/threonine-protein kinase [Citrus sinensis]